MIIIVLKSTKIGETNVSKLDKIVMMEQLEQEYRSILIIYYHR